MSTLVIGAVKSNSTSPPTFQNTNGTEIGTLCRAWVNFNGTGTVAIRQSFNVSSITDNAVGRYTVNFATAMPDANYSALGTNDRVPDGTCNLYQYTTTGCDCSNGNGAGGYEDRQIINVAIFR
jgi:hypothetical protein